MMLSAPAARPLTVQKLDALRRLLFCSCAGEGTLYILNVSDFIADYGLVRNTALNIRLRTDPRAGQGRERQKSTTVR
jgi:hypothetical protein